MVERVKELRKFLKMNMTEFATSINVSKGFISLLESGDRENLSDRTIKDICRVHNVSEQWLRTGEGEMFLPKDREEEIAEIVNEILDDDDEFRLKLIKTIAGLKEESLETLKNIAHDLANENSPQN